MGSTSCEAPAPQPAWDFKISTRFLTGDKDDDVGIWDPDPGTVHRGWAHPYGHSAVKREVLNSRRSGYSWEQNCREPAPQACPQSGELRTGPRRSMHRRPDRWMRMGAVDQPCSRTEKQIKEHHRWLRDSCPWRDDHWRWPWIQIKSQYNLTTL